jgi:hypothetical protein
MDRVDEYERKIRTDERLAAGLRKILAERDLEHVGYTPWAFSNRVGK